MNTVGLAVGAEVVGAGVPVGAFVGDLVPADGAAVTAGGGGAVKLPTLMIESVIWSSIELAI